MKICTVEGCEKPFIAKGFCQPHYDRAKRLNTLPPSPTPEERFWLKVEKTESCWNWVGGKSSAGYGQIWDGASVQYAHRVSYEKANGPIPAGMSIDHRCHNRGCINPDHLRVVTDKENQQNRKGAQANNLSSGIRGVTWNKDVRKWQTRVSRGGQGYYLGLYSDLAEAEAVVIAKRLELFTHNDVDRRVA